MLLNALFEYQFMQNALIAGILASIVCGIIGVIVVEKKLVMMSGGIAHTAYGGVGFGYLIGFEPIIGAFIFAISAAFGIGFIKRRGGARSDVIISLFWSLGMALGIVFIALTPGYPPDLSSYLFGNILSVTRSDLLLMLILTIIVALIISAFFRYWKAYLFDHEFAAILGMKTTFFEYLLLVLVAMTVVVLIRVAGIIMVLSLLTAPAALAALISNKLKSRMLLAIGFGVIFCVAGLWISYEFDVASGACIVILSVISYFAGFLLKTIKARRRKMKLLN